METLVWNNDMLVSAIILTLTFVAIFTEEIHKIHRVKSAMAGAAIMIVGGQIMGFYDRKRLFTRLTGTLFFCSVG